MVAEFREGTGATGSDSEKPSPRVPGGRFVERSRVRDGVAMAQGVIKKIVSERGFGFI